MQRTWSTVIRDREEAVAFERAHRDLFEVFHDLRHPRPNLFERMSFGPGRAPLIDIFEDSWLEYLQLNNVTIEDATWLDIFGHLTRTSRTYLSLRRSALN